MNCLVSLKEDLVASSTPRNPPVPASGREVTLWENVLDFVVQILIASVMFFVWAIAFLPAMFAAVLIAPGTYVFGCGLFFWMLFGIVVVPLYSRLAMKGFDVDINYFNLKRQKTVRDGNLFY